MSPLGQRIVVVTLHMCAATLMIVISTTFYNAVFIGGMLPEYEERLGTFDVARRKQTPADLDWFGWCTWDAFYQAVDPKGVTAGLRSLAAAGTPTKRSRRARPVPWTGITARGSTAEGFCGEVIPCADAK